MNSEWKPAKTYRKVFSDVFSALLLAIFFINGNHSSFAVDFPENKLFFNFIKQFLPSTFFSLDHLPVKRASSSPTPSDLTLQKTAPA